MCTFLQGATNSVAHMVNAMNKILRDFVPKVAIPFLDDVPITECSVNKKDEKLRMDVKSLLHTTFVIVKEPFQG